MFQVMISYIIIPSDPRGGTGMTWNARTKDHDWDDMDDMEC